MANDLGKTLVDHDILPIFIVKDQPGPVDPVEFCGTGFLIAPRLLVTCWHCVRADPPLGSMYAALVHVRGTQTYEPFRIEGIERDRNGADLATGNVQRNQSDLALILAESTAHAGTGVWTAGYPLTTATRDETGAAVHFQLNFRFLQGYIMRSFRYSPAPTVDSVPSYELDMHAPAGLSGAPILGQPSRSVLGVVYGRHDVQQIEEFASVHPATGERRPEIVRIVSFALAHYTETLWALRTSATADRSLKEFLETRHLT